MAIEQTLQRIDLKKPVIIGVATILVLITALQFPVKDYLETIHTTILSLGILGPLLIALFYIPAAVFMLPGSILTLFAGFVFGMSTGFITVWIGATLGACTAFLVGRTIAREWINELVKNKPRFNNLDTAVAKQGFKLVLLLRLSPLFPFNVLNYALGLTRIRFPHYCLATALGMIPGILMYVYIGAAAGSLMEISSSAAQGGLVGEILFWIRIIVTIAAAIVVTRIVARSLKMPVAQELTQLNRHINDYPTDILPNDSYNQQLLKNVRPANWTNPRPAEKYNLVVIGAGTAGLVTAAGAAGLGAKVALVERSFMGGDCLNFGCVPSKSLIAHASKAHHITAGARFGIKTADTVIDSTYVLEQMRKVRSRISNHDSVERFSKLGIDVFLGSAAFLAEDTVLVGEDKLKFQKGIIATGARAFQPAIPGLDSVGFLTNETVFSLNELPKSMAVIGGGPIGCELAQAFQRLGSQVHLIHKNARILDREDEDASDIILSRFQAEGINVILNAQVLSVRSATGAKELLIKANERELSVAVNEILIGVGRSPNIEGLNLEKVGVRYNSRGIEINDYSQTSNPRIYAIGDVAGKYKFTHAADASARAVIQNALFFNSQKMSAIHIPWCTYTQPELAHIGIYESEAHKDNIELDTIKVNFDSVDRALTEEDSEGFIKIHIKRGSDKILGSTIVGTNAGDLISHISVAMSTGIGLKKLSGAVFPYPTRSEIIKKAADAYNRSRLTPTIQKVFSKWFAWNRK